MAVVRDFIGRGWRHPFAFDPSTGGVAKDRGSGTAQKLQRIADSLAQILGVSRGEMFLRRKRGSALQDMVFQRGTANLEQRLEFVVLQALENRDGFGEPRIFVDRVRVTVRPRDPTVDISVDYTIASTNTQGNACFPYYLTDEERTAVERGLRE